MCSSVIPRNSCPILPNYCQKQFRLAPPSPYSSCDSSGVCSSAITLYSYPYPSSRSRLTNADSNLMNFFFYVRWNCIGRDGGKPETSFILRYVPSFSQEDAPNEYGSSNDDEMGCLRGCWEGLECFAMETMGMVVHGPLGGVWGFSCCYAILLSTIKIQSILAQEIIHPHQLTTTIKISTPSLIPIPIQIQYPSDNSLAMQSDYNEKRLRLPPAKREQWSKEQAYIRSKLIPTDSFPWLIDQLELVAAVDVSFSGRYDNGACAGLLIYSIKQKKVIYEDYLYVKLAQEYVPGFLAFRELPPTLELFRRLKANQPHLWPQVVLVDGNGILHKNQCGYACHLGVLIDLPTIGCAKSFFDIDGLHQSEVEEYLRGKLRVQGESVGIVGKSGRQWCKAMLVDENQEKHIFVSIGHRISLSTATQIVLKLTHRDGPEPIIMVDRHSRRMIKRMKEQDYQDAKSYEMVYLLK